MLNAGASTEANCQINSGVSRPHGSQRNGLSQNVCISVLESADRNNINLAVQESPQIQLQIHLIEYRCTRTEFDQEVHVGLFAILAAGNRAKYLDGQGMAFGEQTLDLISSRNHGIANLAHGRILAAWPAETIGAFSEPREQVRAGRG